MRICKKITVEARLEEGKILATREASSREHVSQRTRSSCLNGTSFLLEVYQKNIIDLIQSI